MSHQNPDPRLISIPLNRASLLEFPALTKKYKNLAHQKINFHADDIINVLNLKFYQNFYLSLKKKKKKKSQKNRCTCKKPALYMNMIMIFNYKAKASGLPEVTIVMYCSVSACSWGAAKLSWPAGCSTVWSNTGQVWFALVEVVVKWVCFLIH
jgi:hypothetical protein